MYDTRWSNALLARAPVARDSSRLRETQLFAEKHGDHTQHRHHRPDHRPTRHPLSLDQIDPSGSE